MTTGKKLKKTEEKPLTGDVPIDILDSFDDTLTKHSLKKKDVVRKLAKLFLGWTEEEQKAFYFQPEGEQTLTDLIRKLIQQELGGAEIEVSEKSDLKKAAMAVMTIFEGQKGQRVIMSEKDRASLAKLLKTIGPAVKKARKAN